MNRILTAASRGMICSALGLALTVPALDAHGQLGTERPERKSTDAATSRADLPKAASLVEGALEAMGGMKNLTAIKSRYVHATVTTPMGEVELEIYNARPDQFLMSQSMGGSEMMKAGSDGKTAWLFNPMAGYQVLPEEEGKEMGQQADMLDRLINLKKEYPDMETVEKTEFAGEECYKVKMTEEGGKQFGFFSIATRHIAGLELTEEGPMGPMTVVVKFSEWKKYGDVLLYTKMAMEQMGMQMDMIIDKMEINKVDPTIFALPDEVKTLAREGATSRPATTPGTGTGTGSGG